ncbi:hypothetical protein MUN82_05155 [Hymenobacter aerilatus]|uniref:Uncharacterized protein n=1 Tax=Hymenobacter aerilatus TaxID=2932251 RepID=A0A8T9T0I0_9BACT|nr:hypothetical protein [Hymenobacter aerilatus]UOR06483.1 hypothetical protein MUN82_05155 [Hymenobacter aerilatus]
MLRFLGFSLVGLLLGSSSYAQQPYTAIPKSHFRLLYTNTPLYTTLADTATAPAQVLTNQDMAMVIGFLNTGWAVVEHKQKPYYTPIRNLDKLAEALVSRYQAPIPLTTPTAPVYGTVEVYFRGFYYTFSVSEGVLPAREADRKRKFPSEAAILNFFYDNGWEVLPNGAVTNPATSNTYFRYMLKRRPLFNTASAGSQ